MGSKPDDKIQGGGGPNGPGGPGGPGGPNGPPPKQSCSNQQQHKKLRLQMPIQ